MSLRDAINAFCAADAVRWPGLTPDATLTDVGALVALADDLTATGVLGAEARPARWVSAWSQTYDGGFRVWFEGERVLVLEGRDPVDADGAPLAAPDLGEPEASLETTLGRLRLDNGERVFPGLGLALRVNPANDVLLGVIGFAPTTLSVYEQRLRPVVRPDRLLR
jgi:hypothetical protein